MRLKRVQRWSDVEWLRWSLSHLPETILELASPEWWLLHEQKYSFMGISKRFTAALGDRDPETTTCYDSRLNAVMLHPSTDHVSTPVHEFGHAVDRALGWPSRYLEYSGTPLDPYAAINHGERFAQVFTAYFRGPRSPRLWLLHNVDDARRLEPDLSAFIESLT